MRGRYVGASDEKNVFGNTVMNFEWHLSSQHVDEKISVSLAAAVAKLKRVPLPRVWKESADAGAKWRRVVTFSKTKDTLPVRLETYATRMNTAENVEQDLASCCPYPPPVVGKFQFAILGTSSGEKLHPKAYADAEWNFKYERGGKYPYSIEAARKQKRRAEYWAPSIPAKIPQAVVNAGLAGLLMERLPLNAGAAPFLRTRVEPGGPKPTILAIGLPKPFSELPPVKRFVEDGGGKRKKAAASVTDYLLLAHVHDNIYMTHPASKHIVWRRHSRRPDTTGVPYFKSKVQPRDVETLSLEMAASSDDPTRRRVAAAAVEKNALENAARLPARLEDVNSADGTHRGLRDTAALAKATAEIMNANREKRKLDTRKAMELVECDPNRWEEGARKQKWLFLWKIQSTYHVGAAYIEKLLAKMKPVA